METALYVLKEGININSKCKIIKAEDYQQFITADTIVDQAMLRSKEVIDAAYEEAETIKQKANDIYADIEAKIDAEKKKGYEQGLIEGKNEAARKMTQQIIETEAYLRMIENEIKDAITSGIKLILGKIDDHELMGSLVEKALNSVRDQKRIRLRVAPDQVEIANNKINEIKQAFPDIEFIEVVPEARLDNSGCILETKMGFIDVSVDVQLELIRTALQKRFNQLKK